MPFQGEYSSPSAGGEMALFGNLTHFSPLPGDVSDRRVTIVRLVYDDGWEDRSRPLMKLNYLNAADSIYPRNGFVWKYGPFFTPAG